MQNPSFSLQSCFFQSNCLCHVKSQPVSPLDVAVLAMCNACMSLLPLALKEMSNIDAGYDSEGLPCRYKSPPQMGGEVRGQYCSMTLQACLCRSIFCYKIRLNLRLGLKIQMIGFRFYITPPQLYLSAAKTQRWVSIVLMLQIRYSVFISNPASLKFYPQASSSEAIRIGALS